MKKFALLLLSLVFSSLLNAQDQKAPAQPSVIHKDSISAINAIIARAVEIGKHDSSAAEILFRSAINKSNRNDDPFLAGKAYYEMAQMFYQYKNHNRSFGAF